MGQSMVHAEKITMIKLLKFIVSFFSILFDEYKFSIKESKNSGNRFAGASILLTSNEVEIFLAIEKDEIVVYFRSVFDERKNSWDSWYSSDLILTFLGHKDCLGVIDDRHSVLLRDRMNGILKHFSKNEYKKTLSCLDEIRKERSKAM